MEERYSFITDWYDSYASINRQYQLVFFPSDSTCEMIDIKQKRLFLRRSPSPVKLDEIFLGAVLNILSRQLKVVDFADDFTRSRLETRKQITLALIKPDSAIAHIGEILNAIISEGLTIAKMRMLRLTLKEAERFYRMSSSQILFNDDIQYISSGPLVAIELVGENAIQRWADILGPSDPAEARQVSPSSLRARFGTDQTHNVGHGSIGSEVAGREVEFFFKEGRGEILGSPTAEGCTLCIIKPDALKAGLSAKIIQDILSEGLEITGLGLYNVEKANAEEFYEVYKGVLHEYPDMVSLLTSGPSIAIALSGRNAQAQFRQLCGPPDPEIARHLRPHTLRAKYGKNKLENGVHCTDLPEDGPLEVEYFFKILDNGNN
ncbi:PREDICTED: nucleoside diphosphate kinase 7-like [Amphimedon queenslandica]|uniref:DM10 domain-containing protein n=1 Tax=Amphimedon queenslandica TaxID=400682 RepID=A0A1X7UVW0_AMPQE|nr:PREDICTED: nucleoside diphosphate kinase 7-like [Amphimedon queenslandica]|eukprot:XP_003386599.1 PREDICTED: nucleoside diphosphate kinase 7-like [Amphimedon queenslandica]